MLGQMMEVPLLVSMLLEHAERHHGEQQIVSRQAGGELHRYTYREMAARARRLANALRAIGIEEGTRVGTLAWNGYRHLELYYAASGAGAILHTINPRLHADQLCYIAGHADDQVLFFDLGFLPQAEQLAASTCNIKAFVALASPDKMPAQTSIANLLCYETLVNAYDDKYAWPCLDERRASSLCYTSGTTGNPKGVLYSHRSTVLHAMSAALPDAMNCGARDTILAVVPMFHVNAWGLPYIACMVGAKLVLPGPALDGASLHALCESEGVTLTAGVPTVWQGLLAYVHSNRLGFSSLRRMIIGGAACPTSMITAFQDEFGIEVLHAWGMTEMSPLGTVCAFKPGSAVLDTTGRLALQSSQGRAVFGVDLKLVDADGSELAWDGRQSGELQVRGPWIASAYFGGEGGNPLSNGWFPTGDVARIDAAGYMTITDRSKDAIKSGGEWIGSVELETIAMAHPAVALAACIGVPHPKWDERPLLIVVPKSGACVSRAELLAFYDGKIAKWWTPDDVVFVDEIPLGATGKMLKQPLREQYRSHRLPTA